MNDLKVIDDLSEDLESDPEFSLKVDPKRKYRMSKEQKAFISHYIEFMSIPLACDLAGISIDEGKEYFKEYNTQQEIKRINRAKYIRQFNTKMLNLKEIGGYLTSVIMDNNTSSKDNIKIGDKLKSAQMLIDINKYMDSCIKDPSMIIDCNVVDIEKEIKDLSVKSIKSLIESNKVESINVDDIPNNSLTVEQEAYIKNLPVKDLLNTIESLNIKDKGEDNEDK